jgi:hypothetical protein
MSSPTTIPAPPAEIKKITDGKLFLGFDTISDNGSTQLVDAFGSDADIPKGRKN